MRVAITTIIAIFGFLSLLISIFFTSFGSNLVIKPILNSSIQKEIEGAKVEVTEVAIKPKYIKLEAKVEDNISCRVEGDFDYFKESFDLKYSLFSSAVTMDSRVYRVDLNLKGRAKGVLNSFTTVGVGTILQGKSRYQFSIKNRVLKSITLDIGGAKISQLFLLFKRIPLVDGFAYIEANIPNFNKKVAQGEASLMIDEGRFNRDLIAKELNVIIPKDERFNLNLHSAPQGKYFITTGDINTTTLKIDLKRVISQADLNIHKGYFNLDIDNLSRLSTLIRRELYGSLSGEGSFYINLLKNMLQVSFTTSSFGGVVSALYINNKIKAELKGLSIPKTLEMFGEIPYIKRGELSGYIDIDLNSLNSNFELNSSGKIDKTIFEKPLPSYNYTLKTSGALKGDKLYFSTTDIITEYMNLRLKSLEYNIVTDALIGNFYTDIKELKAFAPFIKQELNGALQLKGDIKTLGSKFVVKAFTNSLQGDLQFILTNNSLNAKFKEIFIAKILNMLQKPPFITQGVVSGSLKLTSIDELKGFFTLKGRGVLSSSILKKAYNIDTPKDIIFSAKVINGAINRDEFKGVVIFKSDLFSLFLKEFTYNKDQESISAKYKIDIANLSQLRSLTTHKIKGKIRVEGIVKYDEDLTFISGFTSKFNGAVEFFVKNRTISLNGAGLNVIEILDDFYYPKSFDGVAKLDLNYSQEREKGKFNITINEAKFLNKDSKLIKEIKRVTNVDLTQELFSALNLSGDIEDSIITFNLNGSSSNVKLKISSGLFNLKRKKIMAKLIVEIKGKTYKFRVSGNINKPHIKLTIGGTIKERLFKKVKSSIHDKDIRDSLDSILNSEKVERIEEKIDEKIKKAVPKDIKSLFKNLKL